jgi:hypothetical protein
MLEISKAPLKEAGVDSRQRMMILHARVYPMYPTRETLSKCSPGRLTCENSPPLAVVRCESCVSA